MIACYHLALSFTLINPITGDITKAIHGDHLSVLHVLIENRNRLSDILRLHGNDYSDIVVPDSDIGCGG